MTLRTGSFLALLLLASVAVFDAPVRADEKKEGAEAASEKKEAKEPVTSVSYAKSWDEAIKEAKSRNVPIVVHHHGFYCPPCWGMHQSLLCDKAYIEFSYENTVEVLALSALQGGVDKNEERAATFDAKEGSKKVKYLVEFPGLTVDEALALHRSKASTYNKEGNLPYTAIIDPFTEEEMKAFKGGGIATTAITEAVTAAHETLMKAHGKGKVRPELRAVADVETLGADKAKAGDFAGGLDAVAAATKKADKDGWPAHMRDRLGKVKETLVAAATEALDKVEAKKASDAAQAKKDLVALQSKLRGTGLEQRAKDLLATL